MRRTPLFLSVLLCVLHSIVAAAPIADGGPDIRVAADVPIILDGSASTAGGSARYLWEQTSGTPLDVIGQDRTRAMVISAQPGSYTFRLTVFDGPDTDTDSVDITVISPAGRRLYVDNQLSANTTTYSIAHRNGSGNDGLGFKTLQAAADATRPGDVVLIRGGEYPDVYQSSGVWLQPLLITTSGTAEAPIRYQNYNSEHVVLSGFGFEDQDLNNDGYADGPAYPNKRETMVRIVADYIQIIGLEMRNSQQWGLTASGNFDYVAECIAHDNWSNSFQILNKTTATIQGSVFRWLESYQSRHGYGAIFGITEASPGFLNNSAVVDCLFYKNGYQPDGQKVLPTQDDPQGGGNADGAGASKSFADKATTEVENWGLNNFIIRNISYHNADDGFDTSFAASLIEGNLSLLNGPNGNKGYKMLRNVRGMVYRGNLAYKNQSVGFELRPLIATILTVYQNTAVSNNSQGILILTAGTQWNVINNVCAFNGLRDFVPAQVPAGGNNWAADGVGVLPLLRGDPKLNNSELTVSWNFDPTLPVRQKWAFIESQIRLALRPKRASGLVNAGQVIPGYHCPRADDDPVAPMPRSDPRRHWYGLAPDIGAFEFNP